MANFVKSSLRNIVIIIIGVIILIALLRNSEQARRVMVPKGAPAMPGTQR